jgi:aminoglycoside N3'-acetyltransferase
MVGYTEADLSRALEELDVASNGVLHVHASLYRLGNLLNVPTSETPSRILRVLQGAVGPEGTITVPASFDEYARFGTPYDCRRSPVDRAQGVFSQFVASIPEAVRTHCPMCGVAGTGPLARDICHQPTGSGFGTGSAWDRLYEHDAQILFLGVRPALAFTFVLYIQARFGVPYLYNKLYTIPTFDDGASVSLPITCAVRYLDADYAISENCRPYEQRLFEQGLVREQPVGRGQVYLIPSARAAFAEGTRCLEKDLYFFLAHPPTFVRGRIPTDGNTGPYVPDAVRFSRTTQSG